MRWWPYHNGHYLLNKNIDLTQLFNERDHAETMDMIDNLIIADGAYDSRHDGQIIKGRTALNKEYGRMGVSTITDDSDFSSEIVLGDDGMPEYAQPPTEDDYTAAFGIAPQG